MSKKFRYRSSVDGRTVTPEYATANKSTTQKEEIDTKFPAGWEDVKPHFGDDGGQQVSVKELLLKHFRNFGADESARLTELYLIELDQQS